MCIRKAIPDQAKNNHGYIKKNIIEADCTIGFANRSFCGKSLATITGRGRINPKASSSDMVKNVSEVFNENGGTVNGFAHYPSCSSVGIGKGNSVIIDVFGDSTMKGATPGNVGVLDPKNPPATLQTTLANLGYFTTVNNRAFSGTTLDQMISGTDSSGQTFEDRVSTSEAKVIYCNHGINDNNRNNNLDTYRLNWILFVNICRKYDKIPVIVTPNPNPPIGLITEAVSKSLVNYVDVARDVARVMKVDLVDNYYYLSRSMEFYPQTILAPDGAHMISIGYQLAGQNMAIPFVNTSALKSVGDMVSLSNTTYFDTFKSGRQLNAYGDKTGVTLTGVKDTGAGINVPIIIDACTKECVLAMYGPQSASGTYGYFGYNGEMINDNYQGAFNQKDTRVGGKFNGMFLPEKCKLTPGLHIIGIGFSDTAESGKYIGVGGFKLIPRNEACRTYYDPIVPLTKVSGSFDFSYPGSKLQFADITGNVILLKIENTGTAINVIIDGVTTLIASGSGARYDYEIKFTLNSVIINIGSVTKTIPLANQMPDMYIIPQSTQFFKQI